MAGFRSIITHFEENVPSVSRIEGNLTIKLFNQVAEELCPVFLKKGIWTSKEAAEVVFKERFDKFRSNILNIETLHYS